MSNIFRIIYFSIFLLILTPLISCTYSINKLYDGDELDRKDLVVIWADWNVNISHIDGKKVGINSTWEQYSILPGKHTFTINANIDESLLLEAEQQNISITKQKTVTKTLYAGQCYYAGYHFLYPVSSELTKNSSVNQEILMNQAQEYINIYSYEKSMGHDKHAEGSAILAATTILSLSNKDNTKIHSYVFDIYNTEKGVLFEKPNLKREHDFWGNKRYHNRCIKIHHGVFTLETKL